MINSKKAENCVIDPISIEDVLASKCKFRILELLNALTELNVSAIIKQSRLSPVSAKRNLDFLEKHHFIKKKKFGRIIIYEINRSNPQIQAITQLFRRWDELQS